MKQLQIKSATSIFVMFSDEEDAHVFVKIFFLECVCVLLDVSLS